MPLLRSWAATFSRLEALTSKGIRAREGVVRARDVVVRAREGVLLTCEGSMIDLLESSLDPPLGL